MDALVPNEPVALRKLWPLLPETVDVPLTDDVVLPVLLFFQDGWPKGTVFSSAEIHWIPQLARDLYGSDPERVKELLDSYPALRGSTARVHDDSRLVIWRPSGHGLELTVEWREPLLHGDETFKYTVTEDKTFSDIRIPCYRSAEDFVVTPAVGSMATGLHPVMALWAVLLGLSSLARYEPATWSKMIDIDKSVEANAIEHLLEEVAGSISLATLYILTSFK